MSRKRKASELLSNPSPPPSPSPPSSSSSSSSPLHTTTNNNNNNDSPPSSPSVCASVSIPTLPLHTVDKNNKKKNIFLPIVGIGTYKFKKNSEETKKAVLNALSVGIRHIDTAFIYGGEQTEKEIGKALKSEKCKVPREELFITSKQWRAYHGYEQTKKCLELSLKRLQTDFLDLYLIHWPGPAYSTMSRKKEVIEKEGAFAYAKEGHGEEEMVALRAETWRAMEDAVYEGKCKAIGVSNFTPKHLESLRKTARIWPPAVNQIELHPYNSNTKTTEYCKKNNIIVVGYASLGGQDVGKKTWKSLGGKLVEREEVKEVAERHGRSCAQVLLRWAVELGHAVIPKTGNIKHLQENIEIANNNNWKDGGLSEEDMKKLGELEGGGKGGKGGKGRE